VNLSNEKASPSEGKANLFNEKASPNEGKANLFTEKASPSEGKANLAGGDASYLVGAQHAAPLQKRPPTGNQDAAAFRPFPYPEGPASGARGRARRAARASG
jgi:hypothetical protein